jgi:hypothetical protein
MRAVDDHAGESRNDVDLNDRSGLRISRNKVDRADKGRGHAYERGPTRERNQRAERLDKAGHLHHSRSAVTLVESCPKCPVDTQQHPAVPFTIYLCL